MCFKVNIKWLLIVGQSEIRLLKLSFPVLFCNLLITAKPPLSSNIELLLLKTLE